MNRKNKEGDFYASKVRLFPAERSAFSTLILKRNFKL